MITNIEKHILVTRVTRTHNINNSWATQRLQTDFKKRTVTNLIFVI
jgi:hypothetical protein